MLQLPNLAQISPTSRWHYPLHHATLYKQARSPPLSLPVLSDILGVGGNLSCLYNKATAQCLWHHIHGNPNIACTGKEDFIRWLGGGSFWGGAVGEGCLWDAGLCWEGPGYPPGLGHPLRQCLPGANDAHFWLALAFHLLLHHPRWCLGLAAAHLPALPAAKSHG